jgi:putative restriction endonuclease
MRMGFGVFIHRDDSIYNDLPSVQYQFPSQYYSRAVQCIGSWVVYYEPRKIKNTKGYFATAKLSSIFPDVTADNMFLAIMEPGSYIEFADPVPFVLEDGGLAERGVLNDVGRISGRAQAAVRSLSEEDFVRIVARGLGNSEVILPRVDLLDHGAPQAYELDETQSRFGEEADRVRAIGLTSRIVRDRVFRRVVLRAYDERCAVTGIKLINGGGRAEVAAAHIRPVEANGPDEISNGLALSGTAHWMFDRGLISVSDDREILISRQVNDRDSVTNVINKSGRLIGPLNTRDGPHPAFLRWHRENCFKM